MADDYYGRQRDGLDDFYREVFDRQREVSKAHCTYCGWAPEKTTEYLSDHLTNSGQCPVHLKRQEAANKIAFTRAQDSFNQEIDRALTDPEKPEGPA